MYADHPAALRTAHLIPLKPHMDAMGQVVRLVSQYADVPESQIFNASRCQVNVARARQLAMYLTHVILGESLTAIGQAFGRDRTTVSYACALIEDLRDDLVFDAEVTDLEMQLQNQQRAL